MKRLSTPFSQKKQYAPEGVVLGQLELLELGAHAPALVVRQRVAVLLEQRVDPAENTRKKKNSEKCLIFKNFKSLCMYEKNSTS